MYKRMLAIAAISLVSCKKSEGPATGPFTPPVTPPTIPVPALEKSERAIVLAEQLKDRIIIVDSTSGGIMWEWSAEQSNLPVAHRYWFTLPDEAKPVYNCKYLLITASRGGVALIRIADKKVMFYARPEGNPHSAELLPDGNIAVVSSEGAAGNALRIYKTDTLHSPATAEKVRYYLDFAHNVVWDRQRQLLLSAANNVLHEYSYNGNSNEPVLKEAQLLPLPGADAHDLFPVYGQNKLWLTNTTQVLTYDIATQKTTATDFTQANIKSVSSGPAGYSTIIIKPKVSYWTDEVITTQGQRVFQLTDLKIYKARWFINNPFSYTGNDQFIQPQ